MKMVRNSATAFLDGVEALLGTCWQALGTVGNVAMFVIMFGVSADAILRYTLNSPITGMLEGVELLLVFAVFLCLARTQAVRGHIAVDILTQNLTGRWRATIDILSAFLGFVLFSVVTWASSAMALRSWKMEEYSAGLIAFPIYPSRTLVALGCFFLSLQLLLELCRAVMALGEGADSAGRMAESAEEHP